MVGTNKSSTDALQSPLPTPDELKDNQIASLQELYSLEGEPFIQAAYRTFLGRDAYTAELQKHQRALERGISKSAIAASLRYSRAARSRPQNFHLRKEWLIWLPAQIPVIGRFFETIVALAGSAGIKRQVLIHQRQLHEQNQLREHDARRLDKNLTSLAHNTKLDFAALRNDYQELSEQLARITHRETNSGEKTDPVDDGFYLAFEEHFRGSDLVIRERLAFYLPIIKTRLPAPIAQGPMVDIGCGRGEWLSLLKDEGYQGTGIDLNGKNIDTCKTKGLHAIEGDAIAWLRQQEHNSLSLISSFHVIEHLTLGQLNTLLVEAIRTLQPGGLLILETPNPENLITAANLFYTDPTHRNPLPPELTEFLLKYKGFHQVDIHRLHPVNDTAHIVEDSELAQRWNSLFYGPQDYAVIGCKPIF